MLDYNKMDNTNDSPDNFFTNKKRNRVTSDKIESISLWLKVFDEGNWGVVYTHNKNISSLSGNMSKRENINRLYLLVVIEFLEWIKTPHKKIIIDMFTDNVYIANLFNEWMYKWERTDFKCSSSSSEELAPRDFKCSSSSSEELAPRHFKCSDNKDRPNGDLLRIINNLLGSDITINVYNEFSKNEFTEKVETLCYNELKNS